jgi:hypothetical protein
MTVGELNSCTINKKKKKDVRGKGKAGSKTSSSEESYEVLKVLGVKQNVSACLQHDIYDTPNSCSHPASNRRVLKDYIVPTLLVRKFN